jgi:hypothetical protein
VLTPEVLDKTVQAPEVEAEALSAEDSSECTLSPSPYKNTSITESESGVKVTPKPGNNRELILENHRINH